MCQVFEELCECGAATVDTLPFQLPTLPKVSSPLNEHTSWGVSQQLEQSKDRDTKEENTKFASESEGPMFSDAHKLTDTTLPQLVSGTVSLPEKCESHEYNYKITGKSEVDTDNDKVFTNTHTHRDKMVQHEYPIGEFNSDTGKSEVDREENETVSDVGTEKTEVFPDDCDPLHQLVSKTTQDTDKSDNDIKHGQDELVFEISDIKASEREESEHDTRYEESQFESLNNDLKTDELELEACEIENVKNEKRDSPEKGDSDTKMFSQTTDPSFSLPGSKYSLEKLGVSPVAISKPSRPTHEDQKQFYEQVAGVSLPQEMCIGTFTTSSSIDKETLSCCTMGFGDALEDKKEVGLPPETGGENYVICSGRTSLGEDREEAMLMETDDSTCTNDKTESDAGDQGRPNKEDIKNATCLELEDKSVSAGRHADLEKDRSESLPEKHLALEEEAFVVSNSESEEDNDDTKLIKDDIDSDTDSEPRIGKTSDCNLNKTTTDTPRTDDSTGNRDRKDEQCRMQCIDYDYWDEKEEEEEEEKKELDESKEETDEEVEIYEEAEEGEEGWEEEYDEEEADTGQNLENYQNDAEKDEEAKGKQKSDGKEMDFLPM